MAKSKLVACSLTAMLLLAPATLTAADADKGKELFEQCGMCHHPDKDEKKMGPSLKGLYAKDKMTNGKKPTDENVLAVINEGGNGMPPYQDLLSDEERTDVLAYLKTL